MESKQEPEMDWGLEKKEATKEQVEQLRLLIDECWAAQKEIDKETELLAIRQKNVNKKEAIIKEILEACGLEAFDGTDCTYVIKEDEGEAGPASDEDWERFKCWMKEKYPQAYEGFFKMHMGSLKAFVKKERALAKERGEENFAIPGIPAPNPFSYIKAKAKKQKKGQ